MQIESNIHPNPPLNGLVRVSRMENGNPSIAVLDYEAYDREPVTGEIRMKCYDARGDVIWIIMPQWVVESMVFGEEVLRFPFE